MTGFAFLCCTTDEARLARLRRSIGDLTVPQGVAVELVTAYEESNLAAAYNRLQRQAAGRRIKAYVHDDVTILNRDLIADVLAVFRRPTIGLIGAGGCRYLPDSLRWWDGSGVFGHVLERADGRDRALRLEEPAGPYETVEAVDGLCMITQHDLPWDESIGGFHFYDVAQSTRYVLAGYDVVVPRQPDPWFAHESTSVEIVETEEYRRARDAYRASYDAERRRFWASPVRRRLRRLATRVTTFPASRRAFARGEASQ